MAASKPSDLGLPAGSTSTSLVQHAQALQSILTDFATVTASQLLTFFQGNQTAPDFPDLLKQAVPQIVLPYAQGAAQVTAQWYQDVQPATDFTATPVVDIPAERIDKTVDWAAHAPTTIEPSKPAAAEAPAPPEAAHPSGLLVPTEPQEPKYGLVWRDDPDVTLSRLAGSASRMINDASRDTVTTNAAKQGIKYARYASANACAFCRVMATRGPEFNSAQSAIRVVGMYGRPRGTRQLGEKWHDHCRCVAVPVPEGQTYEPPDYVQQWQKDYEAAYDAVPDGTPYKQVLSMVLAHMRENTDAR